MFFVPKERGIKAETARKYKVFTGENGTYFPSFSEGEHVGTKVRKTKDEQYWRGKEGEFFGQHLFPPGSAKQITVTEGEFDCMSAFEMMGSKYPVVSVLNGTGSAERDCRNNYEYLNSFQEIVFNFDNDEPGRKAAKKCAEMFTPGKVRLLALQKAKDANDYAVKGHLADYSKEWWKAPRFTPDGLKIGSEMWDEIINRPKHFQVNYPWGPLNRMTYGLRLSEMVLIHAPTGIGKTSILKEIEYELLKNEEVKEKGYGVGFLHLEEPNYDTALGLMSIHSNKPYHLPDTPRDTDELREAYDAVINTDRVVIWDHFGSNSVDAVVDKVRHMAALGCKYIVIDHLTIIVSDQSGDERKQLDEISTKLKTVCMQLNVALICVIHQNRQGQVRGTAGVEQVANIVISLQRDKEDIDPWRRNVTKLVVQKNRFVGRTGPGLYLWYNEMTGRLVELSEEEAQRYEAGDTLRDDEIPF